MRTYRKFLWLVLIASTVVGIGDSSDAYSQTNESTRVYRIAFLAFGHRPTVDETSPLRDYHQSLRKLGYAEGENYVLEERWAGGQLSQLPVLADELIELHPDVFVASGAGAVRAAKRVTQTIPIVIAGAADPVGEGLVASLSHPEGNVTGVSFLPGRELEAKRLELLRELVPGLTRVGVILDSTSQLNPKPLQAAARSLSISLILSGETESPDEFLYMFDELIGAKVDGIYAPETPVNVLQRDLIIELAVQKRIPVMFGSREFVQAGGLVAYGPSFSEVLQRAAIYTDKLLKGVSPSSLPVEQPMRLELVINANSAKAIGISVPRTVLIRANEVIR